MAVTSSLLRHTIEPKLCQVLAWRKPTRLSLCLKSMLKCNLRY